MQFEKKFLKQILICFNDYTYSAVFCRQLNVTYKESSQIDLDVLHISVNCYFNEKLLKSATRLTVLERVAWNLDTGGIKLSTEHRSINYLI